VSELGRLRSQCSGILISAVFVAPMNREKLSEIITFMTYYDILVIILISAPQESRVLLSLINNRQQQLSTTILQRYRLVTR